MEELDFEQAAHEVTAAAEYLRATGSKKVGECNRCGNTGTFSEATQYSGLQCGHSRAWSGPKALLGSNRKSQPASWQHACWHVVLQAMQCPVGSFRACNGSLVASCSQPGWHASLWCCRYQSVTPAGRLLGYRVGQSLRSAGNHNDCLLDILAIGWMTDLQCACFARLARLAPAWEAH